MAVNEGLTVFNLVDGIVDEFHDESGTDEAEGSNDTYMCRLLIFILTLHNQTGTISSWYSLLDLQQIQLQNLIHLLQETKAPYLSEQSLGAFTVPCGTTSVNAVVWGAGGGGSQTPDAGGTGTGGGGGFTSGVHLLSQVGQVLKVAVGEGGRMGISRW